MSKRRSVILCTSIFVVSAIVAGPAYAEKVTLCHVPPGNTANPQTITVGEAAVDAHLEHGDELGECFSCPDSECPFCGNGVAEAPEECDGADLGGQTCATLFGPPSHSENPRVLLAVHVGCGAVLRQRCPRRERGVR